MHGFKRKEAKEQKHWLISIQDPRGGVLKAFSIFAPTEIMQIWSINYSLHFESVKIHKHCLYWELFSTEIYRFFCLSVTYTCWFELSQ